MRGQSDGCPGSTCTATPPRPPSLGTLSLARAGLGVVMAPHAARPQARITLHGFPESRVHFRQIVPLFEELSAS